MISDETFPIELDDEQFSLLVGARGSEETLDTSSSAYSSENSSKFDKSAADRTEISSQNDTTTFDPRFISFEDHTERNIEFFLQPKAPNKKKKSQSCHDLMHTKKNYDHVQSKVKKMIDTMKDEDDRRRKMISRHKSMPITTQTPVDDTFSQEKDVSVLIKELRKKSIKIYELEEKCDDKDSKIYSLEYERSKMKLTFDKLRVEMHELKEKEKDYKHLLSVSPNKPKQDASIQTEEFDNPKIVVYDCNSRLLRQHPAIRELTYSDSALINLSLNQTHFSELNDASSDNLLPQREASFEEINFSRNEETEEEEEEGENSSKHSRKPRKFRRFLKMISCVSK
jgi:hypothetical protein